MGRRKIEIKAIKDDRNRSVTFLKRKGGLFKKAHELSVLCSVDVAVFIFGQNKKLYEYSSGDMRELITRYTYHGGPNEHKGPGDFSGGADDEDDEDMEGTPPGHHEGSVEPQMIPPHYQGQPQFQHLRGHAPSASPPVSMAYLPRGHTPQPQMGSRPSSRTDFRRPSGMPQPGGPHPVPNGYAFMPQPAIYNPQGQPGMPHGMQHPHATSHPPYPTAAQQHHAHQQALQQQHAQQQAHQQAQQQHAAHMRYMEEQRRSVPPPNYPPHAERPPQPSPPQPQQPMVPQGPTQMSPPRVPSRAQETAPAPPPPPQVKDEPEESEEEQEPQSTATMEPPKEKRNSQPFLDTTSAIKKMPQRKSHSIFTPIDEGRSILSQHLASFGAKEDAAKRSSSLDDTTMSRPNDEPSPPPPPKPQRANTSSNLSTSQSADTTFTPPSRSNSLKLGGAARPRLKVQIPAEEGSEAGSQAAVSTGSPPTNTETAPRTTTTETPNPVVVLPPPSPSASTLLSAGATGPPNPFARPPPQAPTTNANGNGSLAVDTPASALPSRYCQNEFLPSPSSFYPDWNFRGHDSNTLPSPLNFATPVVGSGPSFLRDDASGPMKRKSPDMGANGHASEGPDTMEVKRIKVDG